MGLSLTAGSRAIAWLTVLAVLLVGFTDWLQGSPPAGVLRLGEASGLLLFVVASVGVAAGALVIGGRAPIEPAVVPWLGVVALATLAALIADPTYAVLLFAVPLVHIGRRWPEPLRRRTIVALFALAVVLVALEDGPWGGAEVEATLVLFIALAITTMLGAVLGRLDESLARESERARRDEREQLAAELHDSVGHSLLASSIQLRTANALWDADQTGAQRSVELAGRAVEEALIDTRIAVDTVRSRSDPFSLSAALPELIDRITSPALSVSLTATGETEGVDQLTQITLYRVAQEGLTNVIRHAAASSVTIEYAVTAAEVDLTITDDGQGFDVEDGPATLGLRGLEERLARIGGTLIVASEPETGTSLTASVGRVDRVARDR